jgi:hypothetical protein
VVATLRIFATLLRRWRRQHHRLPGVVAILAAATGISASAVQPSGELIERTLAIVGGQAITLLDVRAAIALGLLGDLPADDQIAEATTRLIERTLIVREVQRYAVPEPADTAIDERVATLTARFPTLEARRAALAAVAYSESQLRAWARDDLRIAAYLDQRFASADSGERRAELVRDWIADLRRRTPIVELKK